MGYEHRTLKENVVARAVKMLESTGVKFWIELDGQEYGERPSGRQGKKFDYTRYYEQQLKGLLPGQTIRIEVPADELEKFGITRAVFKDRIRSACGNHFGRENWVVGSDPEVTYVDVLRLE